MTATTLHDRALIRLSGEDVRGFLQGLATSDMAGPLPVWSALLTPQGKVIADFIVWGDGDDVLIDCEAGAAEPLIKRLSMYRLRRAIIIAPELSLAVHWSPLLNGHSREGGSPTPDGAASIDPGLGPRLRGDDHAGDEDGDIRDGGDHGHILDPRLPALGHRWLAPRNDGDASAAWRAHRLALGVTEGAAELADLLWLECNAAELNGVSFTKGCYVGQENTARMNWRQKVNRRLVVVPLADADTSRQRIAYPDLGWSVEHRRIDAIPDAVLRDWMGPRGE